MRLAFLFAALLCTVSCGRSPSPNRESVTTVDSTPSQPSSQAFEVFSPEDGAYETLSRTDSAYIARMVGTFTNTRGIRQVTRIPLPPACNIATRVYCFRDTTRAMGECCSGEAISTWLVVLDSPDSLEFYVVPGAGISRREATIVLYGVGPIAPFQEHDINTAPYLRYQFPEAGTYTLEAGIGVGASGDTIPYHLRVRDDTRRPQRVLAAPLIHLPGDSTVTYFVRRSRLESAQTQADSHFLARAGWHRILAPGADSVFACSSPCERIEAFGLH